MSEENNNIDPNENLENNEAVEATEEESNESLLGDFSEELTSTKYGKVKHIKISEEMRRSYLNYAMSVIVSRALPDVRDGLKPVHRRILFAMKDMGLTSSSSYKKCARIVGEVLGKYHPHGDTAVYEALVRLAQDFSMRYPLVNGQGNFGSVDGDSAAAMRYTEAKLQKITDELLVDIDKRTVLFRDTFDGSQQEPEVLPARLPNLLLMGSEGIAVGMATKIPPHNLGEVVDAVLTLIGKGKSVQQKTEDNPDGVLKLDKSLDEVLQRLGEVKISPDIATDHTDERIQLATADPNHLIGHFQSEASIDDMLEHIQGPDFPTGGIMFDWEQIKEVYHGGKGRVVVRAKAEITETAKGKPQIIVTELPYQVNKAKLIEKIAMLVRNKKLVGIADLRDESDRKGMSIAIDLKRDAKPKALLNNLYKYTQLQSNFSANIVALNSEGTPQLMNLKTILTEYVRHRQLVITRRSQHELLSALDRAHILEGLLIALDNLDEVISIIRQSPDVETARTRLMERFTLSNRQATAILDMQLRKLAALERKKIEDEYAEIKKNIDYLVGLLKDMRKILNVISTELEELKDKYADPRRTILVKGKLGEFNEEDLVPKEDCIVTITKSGYIKRMSPDAYKAQKRGGVGVTGMKTKEEDAIRNIFMANTHDNLLIFTSKGKVFKLRVHELPEGSRQAKGQSIINLIHIDGDERVQRIVSVSSKLEEIKDKFVTLATQKGIVKRTKVSDFLNIRTTGIIAISLNDGDRLVWGGITDGNFDLLMVTHEGKSIRFDENQIKVTGRDTKGVKGVSIKGDDYVVGLEAIDRNFKQPDDKRRRYFYDLMVITEKGMGKRTPFDEYPTQKRAGSGVKVANITPKTGKVAAAIMVNQNVDHIMITTKSAQVIKMPIKNIPQLKRPTQGVILMRLSKADDVIVSATALGSEEEEAEA